jgi:hypothetical protein
MNPSYHVPEASSTLTRPRAVTRPKHIPSLSPDFLPKSQTIKEKQENTKQVNKRPQRN